MSTLQLSPRARKYLQTLKQDKSWLITTEVLSRYLLKQGVKPTSALLSFQENYSGLILTIQNNKGATFKANLFSSLDIVFNRDEDVFKVGGQYIFECGEHSTAQFNFYITDKGEVCTWEDDNNLNILYSSFDKFVESYAIRNELAAWNECPYYYELLNNELLEEYVSTAYQLIHECSDKYNKWWTNGYSIICRGVWLDRPDYYLHVYAKSAYLCKKLIGDLQGIGVVKNV